MWVLAVVMVMVEEEGGKERRGSKLEAEVGYAMSIIPVV